jgi:hypothetical protein
MPEDFRSIDDLAGLLTPNALQMWLDRRWRELVAQALDYIAGSHFVLLLNGDMIEGIHHGGRQLVSTELADHLAIAEHYLRPLVDAATQTIMTRGTECHTQLAENGLAHRLGATVDDAQYWYQCGVLCSAKHHVATTGREWTRASGLGIALAQEQLAHARCGWAIPRLLFRAHRHTHDMVVAGDAAMATCGGWQMLTRFGWKVVPGSIPQPSMWLADWRRREDGELPDLRGLIATPPMPEPRRIG